MLVMTTAFHSLFFFVLFFLTFAHYIEYIQLFRLLLFFVNRIKKHSRDICHLFSHRAETPILARNKHVAT